jgi:hypothetical protein
MAYTDWRLTGLNFSACNYDGGCPCQFSALPTRGNCRATVAFKIDMGHFGGTKLDGLKAVALAAWPGAMHERNGEILALVDERADAKQREGLCSRSSRASTASPAPQFSTSSRWW